jgi:hypothetical protein
MAETNGGGRLDRIEAILERLAQAQERDHEEFTRDHAQFTRDHKQLMTWQVLMQDKMDKFAAERDAERKRLDQLSEKTDIRIAELVSAIGALIASRSSL